MHSSRRSSDVIEEYSSKVLGYGIGGIVLGALGGLFIYYKGMLMYLGFVFVLISIICIVYAIYEYTQARKVPVVKVNCPYCSFVNQLTEQPEKDFTCRSCHRLIPVDNGRIMRVFQVRCGFCNHLNFYSEKSEGLICEECDREIPISTSDGQKSKKTFERYTHHDDDKVYELVLTGQGTKTEELIMCLQHMLALNRNQVKEMLANLPVTLLTGIPRRKAEMLSAQLAAHDGKAEFKSLS